MTNDIEERLGRGLRDLADVPAPTSLAEGALTRARRARRVRAVTTGLAAVVATGAIAAPFLLRPGGGPEAVQFGAPPPIPQSATPTPAPATTGAAASDDCREAPGSTGGGIKQVEPGDWPEYVRIAMGRLPTGKNWVMQSGYGPCRPAEPDVPNAYSVINLGPRREDGGHVTLNLADESHHQLPQDCASVSAKIAARQGADGLRYGEVAACTEGTASTPLFYAIHTSYDELHGVAVWPDGRAAWMESIPNLGEPLPLDLKGLRAVLTDRELVDQLD